VLGGLAAVIFLALAWLHGGGNAEGVWIGPGSTDKNGSAAKPTEAERISRLTRTIEADEKTVIELQKQLDDPQSEFHQAELEFKQLDEQLAEQKKDIEELKQAGKKDEVAVLEAIHKPLEEQWQLAKDRFNLAIQERKVLQEKIASLKQRIPQNKQVLNELLGVASPTPETPSQADALTATIKAGILSGAKVSPEPEPNGTSKESTPADGAADEKPTTKEYLAAEQEVRAREAAAVQAEARARAIGERLAALRENILLEEKLLATAREKADQAYAAHMALEKDIERCVTADPMAVPGLMLKNQDTLKRFDQARRDVRTITDHLRDLQTELSELQAEQLAAQAEAHRRALEVRAAQDRLESLKNPFTFPNILQWLIDHGPHILLVITGVLVLRWVVQMFSCRIVRLMVLSGGRGTQQERENRAQTLVAVFRNTASLAVLCGGLLMLLDVIGVPVVPLMGGAAVLGLAVAFGAQNLIRDYFSGFMVLLEDQYGINDVVRIGGTAGLVERITLRMTVLRDMEGVVHFIPHGTITTVSNLTHGWSRAVFEIGIAYKENADRVMAVLLDLAREIRKDPTYGPLILDDPQMLGVDGFRESAVIIKFYLKTKPLQQWVVKRELLRRIKRTFDELHIEIPFPHRTIYHHYVDDGAETKTAGSLEDRLRRSAA
jgi:small conductance mechanosensitive channel